MRYCHVVDPPDRRFPDSVTRPLHSQLVEPKVRVQHVASTDRISSAPVHLAATSAWTSTGSARVDVGCEVVDEVGHRKVPGQSTPRKCRLIHEPLVNKSPHISSSDPCERVTR
jgi:hypothetical protein